MKSLRDEILRMKLLRNEILTESKTGSGDRCPRRGLGRSPIINHRAGDTLIRACY